MSTKAAAEFLTFLFLFVYLMRYFFVFPEGAWIWKIKSFVFKAA